MFQIKVNINPEEQFKSLAERLLNHSILKTPVADYRIAEIEFYFYNQCPNKSYEGYVPENDSMYSPPAEHETYKKITSWEISHQDIFTHCSARQEKSGYWYLHQNKNNDTLKNGKRKGIDITIGDPNEVTYGGILIRALYNINTGEYIYGPSKVMDNLVKDLGKSDVNEIADIQDIAIDNTANKIQITKEELRKEKIYACKRYGLKINKDQPEYNISAQEDFINRNYRFFIFPLQEHAGKEEILKEWLSNGKISPEEMKQEFHREKISV